MINVELDWALEQSDHASVLIVLSLVEEDPIGPGLTRVNGQILEDPSILASARLEIGTLMDQVPEDWNPHQTLEYMKVCISSVISGLVGRNRKELKCEIEELEKSLNDMQAIKASVNSNTSNEELSNKLALIERAINSLNSDLSILREKQSIGTAFRAKAKWSELGEKSNKYFLNLNNKIKRQKRITKITCEIAGIGANRKYPRAFLDITRNSMIRLRYSK